MKKIIKSIVFLSFLFVFVIMASTSYAACNNHKYTVFQKMIEDSTCTSPARAKYKCATCSQTTIKSYGKAKGHNYTKLLKVTKEATCSKLGAGKYQCTRSGCSSTTTKSVPKISHKYTKLVKIVKSPTCTKTGSAQYKCTMCTKTTGKSVPKTGHSYKMKSNSTSHYEECTKCKVTRNKGNHTYSYTTTKQATCTEKGTKTGKCSKCNYKTTVSISKISHKPRGWQQGPQGGETHYKVCNNCSKEIEGTRAKHTYDSNGKCTACGIKKQGCMHKHQKFGSCLKDSICYECGTVLKKAPGHDYKVEFDKNTHFERCANYYDIKNKNEHDLRGVNLKNGKHSLSCQKCGYTVTENHKFNANDMCKYCDERIKRSDELLDNTPYEFSPDSEKAKQEIQDKLYELGYYKGESDGMLGADTRKAINMLLEYCGDERRVTGDMTWEDFDSSLCLRILNSLDTVQEKRKELLNDNKCIWTKEEEERFDAIILSVLSNDTKYDRNNLRNEGGFEMIQAQENGQINEEKIAGTLYFDCSTLSGTVYKGTYNFDWIRIRDGKKDGAIYSTWDFENDYTNFKHDDHTKTGLRIDELKKGQSILCINDNDRSKNHVMMYIGNGMIVHANGTYSGVSMNRLSIDDEYTAQFVSINAGDFTKIEVLTPIK